MVDPIVTVKQGKLKGVVKELLDGTPYYSFKGIPYAQKPTGQLRFAAPQPPLPWKGTYEAFNHGPVCPQFDMITRQIDRGDENCLFLNIYTKSLKLGAKLPVMVFIHGGGFMSGSGDSTTFGPEFLLLHDVLLVTINYRLEVLGFLCLDTPEVPGNAGMKDQVFALRWVKENIAQFGGDPDNITIFGESAGSASVTYHLLSPMSKGLFHKAIAQSGVSLCEWSQGKNGKERAFRVGKILGKETNDTTELLEFLRNLPAVELTKLTLKSMAADEKRRGIPIHFAPVIEKKFKNVESFISEEVIDSLLSKKINTVPLMIGYNSGEGFLFVEEELRRLNFTNKNSMYMVPREIAQKIPEKKIIEFGEKIKAFYAKGSDFTSKDAQTIADMTTDMYFSYNIHRFCHFYAALKQSMYLYRFTCDTELNVVKNLSRARELKGASHADELFYMFYNILNKDAYEEHPELRDIVYKVTKLWTDFATTGNPTPDNSVGVTWPPYSRTTRTYLEIGDTFTAGRVADRDRVYFWNKLYSEAGLPCITKSAL